MDGTDSLGSIDETMADTLASIENTESGDAGSATSGSEEHSSDGAGLSTAVGSSNPAVSSSFPAAAQAPAAPQEPWRAMPKSWKQEMRDYWAKQDPAVMQYVHQREEEALRGIGQYKQVADRWGTVLKPYEQQIRQYGIDPYTAVSNLVAVHTILRHGNAQQKAQAAAILERDYGLSQYYKGQGQPQGPDLSPLNNRIATVEQMLQQRALGDASSEVEKFIGDPSNEFASEAAPKMLELLESGRAASLKEAYDLAVKTDPVLFEKLIEKRIKAATTPPARPPTNTRPSRVPPSTAGKARGTIEDTMRETLANITQR